MTTQWHPLFARLLRLLLEDFYQIDIEVPVSDLPRKGDLFLVRKTGTAAPPFVGLWAHLTDWNVLEFKGPSDSPQEADLDLLLHVGTGLGYRFNEERRQRGEPPLANHAISLWYLAPVLGETFVGQARTRLALDYETGGLWRGRVWGHPLYLLAYRDAPVEPDTVPLHFLAPPALGPPAALAELLTTQTSLLDRYEQWLFALFPEVWKEVQIMTQKNTSPTVDYSCVAEYIDVKALADALGLDRLIQLIGPERVAQKLGAKQVVQELGAKQVVQELGAKQVAQELGAEQLIPALDRQEVLEVMLRQLTPEELRQLRQRLPSE